MSWTTTVRAAELLFQKSSDKLNISGKFSAVTALKSGSMENKALLEAIPNEVYAFIGLILVSNIALVASGLTAAFKHLLDHNRMKDAIAEMKIEIKDLKKDLDSCWDRIRGITKP